MNSDKITLILGASPNPERYAYQAAERLKNKKHEVALFGNKPNAEVLGQKIETDLSDLPKNIDTVTVYMSAKNQKPFEEYLLNLKPKRVIFNPGAENPDFYESLIKNEIQPIEACTLVMLSTGQY
jgi:uncharacterized protein